MDSKTESKANEVLKRFPENFEEIPADSSNPAIRLYGRRFYKDQTPVEYLAEFLLVFASPKQADGNGAHSFELMPEQNKPPRYWPSNRVGLKLFAFFPNSRLETRHPAHQKAYKEALSLLQSRVKGCNPEVQEETVRLLQSLFAGFVGVAKNRTWVTHTFLPISTSLLAKEVTWQHPKALRHNEVVDWDSSINYFDENTRNFLGRGGELLFMQLANLFANSNSPTIAAVLSLEGYRHLGGNPVADLAERLKCQLRDLLEKTVAPLARLVILVEKTLDSFRLESKADRGNVLGWVPEISRSEALLFAWEMNNICAANRSGLEKLDLLQTLCCLQVLRSLCFQARRVDRAETDTPGFVGNYAWIAAPPDAPVGTPIRLMAENSFGRIDLMLYRAMYSPLLFNNGQSLKKDDIENGHDNCFRHFRKLSKELGLVVPRQGRARSRFALSPEFLRFLVAALVPPGKRLRLNHFYERAFAHYGLALGGRAIVKSGVWPI